MQMKKAEPELRGLTLLAVVAAWLAGTLLVSWIPLPPMVPLIGAIAALIGVVFFWRNGQGRLIALILLWLLLGAWRYTLASPLNDPQSISRFIGTNKLEIRGSVIDEPKVQGRSRLLLVSVSSVSKNAGSSWQDAHGHIEVQSLGTLIDNPYEPNYGDDVELQGKLQPPLPHSPPDTLASVAFPRMKATGTGGNPIIAALYHLRVLLATSITQALPQPEAALLIAILLGLRTPALQPLSNAFNVTGTAHLIVPSGFKVTILAGLVAASTRWLYEKRGQAEKQLLPAQRRRGNWQRWFATSLVVASIMAYTILSGAGPAAIRAGVMGTILVVAPRLGRIYNVYTALALAALLMSIFDPFVLWDAGFQLSFLGTLGIVVLTPFFQRLLHPIERLPLGSHITEIIAVTLAAQTATLPIFALTFNQVSFIAPIANTLTVPLLEALIFLGILVCSAGLLFAPLGLIIGWAIWPLLWYVTHIITWCAALPGAYLRVENLNGGLAWGYYSLLSLFSSRRWARFISRLPAAVISRTLAGFITMDLPGGTPPSHAPASPGFSRHMWRMLQFGAALLVILATGATALAAQPDGRLTITFLSVGPPGKPPQGEAILIHTPDDKTILVDGGPDATSLSQELDQRLPFWQRSLDMVLLTTSRQDHLVALQDVITRYQVGEVLDAGMVHPNAGYALWRRTISDRNLQYVRVRQGTTIAEGTQVMLQVFWPTSPLHTGSNEELDNTLIVRLVSPGLRVLLVGTAALSKYALTGLMNIDPGYLQADVVQIVGEAGKAFPSELSAVLQAAQPSLLVITPSALTPKQRASGGEPGITPPLVPVLQVVQTVQAGTTEISSSESGWSINTA